MVQPGQRTRTRAAPKNAVQCAALGSRAVGSHSASLHAHVLGRSSAAAAAYQPQVQHHPDPAPAGRQEGLRLGQHCLLRRLTAGSRAACCCCWRLEAEHSAAALMRGATGGSRGTQCMCSTSMLRSTLAQLALRGAVPLRTTNVKHIEHALAQIGQKFIRESCRQGGTAAAGPCCGVGQAARCPGTARTVCSQINQTLGEPDILCGAQCSV